MRRFLPLLALGLTACATGPTLDQRLAAYVGRTEVELVSALGVPVRTYEVEGRKFLQYEEQRSVSVPGDPWGWGGLGYGYGRRGFGGFGGGFYPASTYAVVGCGVTFALRGGRVEGATHRGQGCT